MGVRVVALFESMISRDFNARKYILGFLQAALMFLAVFVFFNISYANRNNPNPRSAKVEMEIQRHKDSVLEIAVFIYQNFPDDFPELNRLPRPIAIRLLVGYILFHDAPKLWTMKELRAAGYTGTETPFEHIERNWGKQLPENEREWIIETNNIEGVFKTGGLVQLCKNLGVRLYESLWRELLHIEDLSDIYDTKLHRRFETNGDTSKPKPGESEEYMRLVRKNEVGARLMRRIEKLWPFRPKQCPALFM